MTAKKKAKTKAPEANIEVSSRENELLDLLVKDDPRLKAALELTRSSTNGENNDSIGAAVQVYRQRLRQ